MSKPDPNPDRKPWSHTVWPPILILIGVALGPSLVTLARRGSMPADPFAFLSQRQVGRGADVVKRLLHDDDLFQRFLRAEDTRTASSGHVVTGTPLNPEVLADGGRALVRIDVRGLAPLQELPLQAVLDELEAIRPTLGLQSSAPYAVEVFGAGRDLTLLKTGPIRPPAGAPMTLALRDLTLICDDTPLVDAPDRPLLLRLRNCRIVGFDGGPDPAVFRARALALYAKHCEFQGGFGSAPGLSTLFDVQTSGLIAVLENGELRNLDLGISSLPHGSGVRFDDVALEELRSRPLKPGSRRGVHFEIEDCPLGSVSATPPPRRSLSELPGAP